MPSAQGNASAPGPHDGSLWADTISCVMSVDLFSASDDEAAVGVVRRLEHSQKEIVLKRGVSYLPGTQSERDSAPERTWSSIYTTEYNRMRGTIVLVSKQRECERQ